MATDGPARHDLEPPLTRSLRQVLIGTATTFVLGGAALVVGMQSLDEKVQGWHRMEVADTKRESLLDVADQFSRNPTVVKSEIILSALDDLGHAIALTDDIDQGAFAKDAMATLTTARQSFVESVALHEQVIRQTQNLKSSVERALDQSSTWAQSLNIQAGDVRTLADENNTQVRVLNDQRELLTVAMLEAVRLQQQIQAVRRLNVSTSISTDISAIRGLDTLGLPAPCQAGAEDAPEQLCRPNSIRVVETINRLRSAGPDETPDLVDAALRALEAYIRAGERTHGNISQEQNELLSAGRNIRQEESQIVQRRAVLSRINNIILEIEALVDRGYPIGNGAVQSVEGLMQALLDQLGARSRGLYQIDPVLDRSVVDMEELVADFDADWRTFVHTLAQRDAAFGAFDGQMSALARMISTRTQALRSATELWVDVFASMALVAMSVLFVVLLSLNVLGRRMLVLPLRQVTNTILNLTAGEIHQPVQIDQRRLGFDQLASALEELRSGMVERSTLAARNQEQTTIIKKNMHALEEKTRELHWLAMHDPMTELGNRRAADEEILRLNDRVDRAGDFCLIHIDTDNFKDTNDTLGHQIGDALLRHIANVLNETVTPAGKCFRIGGDEFLIILSDIASNAGIQKTVKELQEQLNRPIVLADRTVRSSVSMGIAFGKDAGGDAQATLINADFALYEAKRSGRDRFVFYTEELSGNMGRRKSVGTRLISAIETRQFTPYYQPQFFAKTLAFRGVETLCRWQDPQLGNVPPIEFLEVAEEMRLVGQIDQIMFEKAAADVNLLRARGFNIPKISFNVTAQRLAQPELARDLRINIDQGTQVVVELLESMSLDTLSKSMRWSIDTLKDAGIAIEVDDFGSCRASIAGLMAVGPDAMKIDKSLVVPLTESDQHLEMVRAIAQIGKSLGIEVVAEGVETEEHITLLSELGCDVLQGYALARPMPIDELQAFLEARGDFLERIPA